MCWCSGRGRPRCIGGRGEWFDDEEIYGWFGENLHRVTEPSLWLDVRARELKAAGMDWTAVLPAEAENRRAPLATEILSATLALSKPLRGGRHQKVYEDHPKDDQVAAGPGPRGAGRGAPGPAGVLLEVLAP